MRVARHSLSVVPSLSLILLLAVPGAFAATKEPAAAASAPVSFYKQVRPILQAQCEGCHQPAKAKGGYVMSGFARLMAAGDSGTPPIVAGQPDASLLVKQITPIDGAAEMPKGKSPLPATDIELIRRWIAEGAKDDTPANAVERFDAEHPPIYAGPPVVTAIDYSPDGTLLAVAGFHEVLLHHADGSGVAARLIGLSERIQSLRFSPDGTLLAVAGGQPARLGEIQVWNVAKRELVVSAPVGFDTLYGVNWSPDGKLVSFGCPDNTVRAISASTGKQVLQQGSHNDWVLDTVFSTDGSHVISVGRDMSAKLTELATQRFVDNITSITPGALRGGLQSVARHPAREEVLVGGADGVPQIYRIFRTTVRKIGDNASLIRRFPAMEGRIFGVDYSPDGSRIAACASLDGHGQVNLYGAQFDSTLPTNLVKALEKEVFGQSPEERAAIEAFVTSDVKLLHSLTFSNSAVYALSYSPDGRHVAVAGGDGHVRIIDADSGAIAKEFGVAPRQSAAGALASAERSKKASAQPAASGASAAADATAAVEPQPPKTRVKSITVHPDRIRLASRNEHAQLVVVAQMESGDTLDATRLAEFRVKKGLAAVSSRGRLTPLGNGKGSVTVSFGGRSRRVPIEVAGYGPDYEADFIRDVNPVLSKLGCNAGTCHGAREGKNGFKLSLRGYDPVFDVRAFSDDLASRRVNVASPDNSLMLLKATGAVPHEGGQRTPVGSEEYGILRQWIADGARLSPGSARVERIELSPTNPVVTAIGGRQQLRVVAVYGDGRRRDVTTEAFLESGNADVAASEPGGLVTTLRRGEAPLLARYEGAYAATTLTVMGDRGGFAWEEPPAHNRIDALVAAKWKRMKILPSDLCTDAEFVRRVHLDLTGLPPSPEQVRAFLADGRETRVKREALIDALIGSPAFVDHWANKWADLLQVNRKFLGEEGSRLFRNWIREEVDKNTPYDELVRRILTARGSNRENPAASYWKILRTPAETMENTTHLFLATRFNCNKCHDHPFERWTQDQYYGMAAYFAQVEFKKDPESGDRTVGGTAVEGAKPLFEVVGDKSDGDVRHDRTGKVSPPEFPFPAKPVSELAPDASRREALAAWVTSTDNRYFASSYANRIWGYLTGVGLIEPLDDIRAGNPPSNPELLDYLTLEFVASRFDMRHLMRLICRSRTYQLSVVPNRWNEDDRINYSHAVARRLPAEVLLDSVYQVTGAVPSFPGVDPGTRASQLPDAGVDLPSGILATLGRPARESACECERSNDVRLGSVLSLLSGPAVSAAIENPTNAIAQLVGAEADDRKVMRELFLRVLNREPTESEITLALESSARVEQDHQELTNALAHAEREWVVTKARKEQEREAAIVRARDAVEAHRVAVAPQRERMARERLERIAAAETRVQEYAPTLAAHLAEWEQALPPRQRETLWHPLVPKEAKGSGSVRLEKLDDGSYRASGNRGELPDYVVTAELDATNITAIKLDVLPDEHLPAFGPGLNKGDFLLSEVVVERASRTNANKFSGVKIADARADRVATDRDLKHSFDGRSEQGRPEGWALGSDAAGRPHWAVFAFENPVQEPDGPVLRVKLEHRYQTPNEIGRFRLWYTTATEPLHEGLPATVAAILETPAAERTAEQQTALTTFFRLHDDGARERDLAAADARKPLPEDLELQRLELALKRASEPVRTDPALVQLRQDAELSGKQLDRRRLTLAQDVAWALINSPAFLFNH